MIAREKTQKTTLAIFEAMLRAINVADVAIPILNLWPFNKEPVEILEKALLEARREGMEECFQIIKREQARFVLAENAHELTEFGKGIVNNCKNMATAIREAAARLGKEEEK